MKFEFTPFGASAPERSIACDGLVPGADLDLSHWAHNRTPRALKRDTSAEIALAFGEVRHQYESLATVTNNHFDADGVLAVFAVMFPDLARAHASTIIGAAEYGDFDEWPTEERGLWLEAAISALAGIKGDASAYESVLRHLPEVLLNLDKYEHLWGESYHQLLRAGDLVREGRVAIEREGRIAVLVHDIDVPELPGAWMSKLRPSGTDRWLLAFREAGENKARSSSSFGRPLYRYRYELPRYAWADTVVRPRLVPPKRGPIRRVLGDAWIIKGRRGMTGLAYTARAVSMPPLEVAQALTRLEPCEGRWALEVLSA